MTRARRFYAVAEYRTGSPEAANALADQLTARGCNDLFSDHPGNTVQVSYGPFLSAATNLLELAADARSALARIAGPQAAAPEVLTATAAATGIALDLTPITSPRRIA